MSVESFINLPKLQGVPLVALVDTRDHPVKIVTNAVHLFQELDPESVGGQLRILSSFLDLQDQRLDVSLSLPNFSR
jgi:hypothetical protein